MQSTQIREISVKYGKRRAMPETLCHSGAAEGFLRRAIGSDLQETFLAVALDAKNRPVAWYRVGLGGTSNCQVDIASVFRGAIASGATGVLVAHNHPSGDPTPSGEDIALTRRVLDAGKILGMRILDHLVIGETSYVSLRDTGRWPN